MKKIFFLLLLTLIGYLPLRAQFITSPTTRAQLRYNATQLQGAILQTQQKAAIYGDSVLYANGGNAWGLYGNSGTSPATNFIGTTDTATLVFKVGGVQSGWIDDNYEDNTFFGYNTGTNNIGGGGNTAVGAYSYVSNSGGSQNTVLGEYCFMENTTGSVNVAIGMGAVYGNISGNNNIGIGANAAAQIQEGSDNIGIGENTLTGYHGTNGASSCVAVGSWAGRNGAGDANTLIGDSAEFLLQTGVNNVSIGYSSGYTSGYHAGNGSSNTIIGAYAGVNGWTGFNVFVGDSAGYNNTTGSYNTYIGTQAALNATTYTNTTSIGYSSQPTASNQMNIAGNGITSFVIPNTTGSAPSNTTTPVAWEKIIIGGNTYYVPLYQ